jgi:hypothetical protein
MLLLRLVFALTALLRSDTRALADELFQLPPRLPEPVARKARRRLSFDRSGEGSQLSSSPRRNDDDLFSR